MATIHEFVRDPATGVASVVPVDVATTPIRAPQLFVFTATAPMRLATDDGLVEVASGDRVVVSETGSATVYKPAAFASSFLEDAPPPPVTPPPPPVTPPPVTPPPPDSNPPAQNG